MDKLLLTLITFFPLVGAVGVLLAPSHRYNLIRGISVATCAVVCILSFYLAAIHVGAKEAASAAYIGYGANTLVDVPWISQYNIHFRMGVDGFSVLLVALTGALSLLAAFTGFSIQRQVKGFYALYLLLVTGMMGVFMSLDFFLFYIFWETMLLPMYFLIGIWGGPRKEYAAIKFFIYTLAGSVLMLLVILAYYFKMTSLGLGQYAFDIPELIARRPFSVPGGPTMLQFLMFWGLFVCFAIKIPIVPFHTWLPDAHVEAPTAISVILAGVLLKMGGYGLLRLNWPLLPEVASNHNVICFLAILGVVNIIYGAFCALGQTDFKRLVAYSSVSHMGYCLLGIATLTSEGINGSVFQMFAHGLSSGMMFMLVGVIYDRAHHRDINRFGGIGSHMPIYFSLSIIGFFASLGLPGMVGFIGEVMVFLGAFKYNVWIAAVSSIGLVLTAAYILWTMQRVYLGKPRPEYEGFADCNWWEKISLVPLAIACILFGVFPMLILNLYTETTQTFLGIIQAGR
jgi:NADH-quinone oxidoreductase subunit M